MFEHLRFSTRREIWDKFVMIFYGIFIYYLIVQFYNGINQELVFWIFPFAIVVTLMSLIVTKKER